MQDQQKIALRALAGAVLEAVDVAGDLGAPGGTLYAALMQCGCSFQQYQQIMAGMVNAGLLRMSGECYSTTDKGKVINARMHAQAARFGQGVRT